VTLLLALLTGCKGSTVARSTQEFPEQTGFVQRQIQVDGQTKSVWVFIPHNYTSHRLQPAILFLHGLFEQGDGGTNVLSAGLGPVIARNPAGWPFITVFPQSDGTWEGPVRDRLAMAALDDAIDHYQIDPSRVILAGLSYGGLGVWEIGARHRDRFAALVPVSGFSAMDSVPSLAALPVWAFASKEDLFVKPSNSVEMCQAIAARGGQPRLTQFAGGQHDCWPQVVAQPDLIPWLLQQRRNPLQASLNAYDRTERSQTTGRLRMWTDQ
jgi:predicted peptidase